MAIAKIRSRKSRKDSDNALVLSQVRRPVRNRSQSPLGIILSSSITWEKTLASVAYLGKNSSWASKMTGTSVRVFFRYSCTATWSWKTRSLWSIRRVGSREAIDRVSKGHSEFRSRRASMTWYSTLAAIRIQYGWALKMVTALYIAQEKSYNWERACRWALTVI